MAQQIIREIILPELNKEVNVGKNFAQLRQVFNSLILANWYKKKIKDSILTTVYADKNKTSGIITTDKVDPQTIYQNYIKAFKKGAYNIIKEEIDPVTQSIIPRKYFAGGIVAEFGAKVVIVHQLPDIAMMSGKKLSLVAISLAVAGGLYVATHVESKPPVAAIIEEPVVEQVQQEVRPVRPVSAPVRRWSKGINGLWEVFRASATVKDMQQHIGITSDQVDINSIREQFNKQFGLKLKDQTMKFLVDNQVFIRFELEIMYQRLGEKRFKDAFRILEDNFSGEKEKVGVDATAFIDDKTSFMSLMRFVLLINHWGENRFNSRMDLVYEFFGQDAFDEVMKTRSEPFLETLTTVLTLLNEYSEQSIQGIEHLLHVDRDFSRADALRVILKVSTYSPVNILYFFNAASRLNIYAPSIFNDMLLDKDMPYLHAITRGLSVKELLQSEPIFFMVLFRHFFGLTSGFENDIKVFYSLWGDRVEGMSEQALINLWNIGSLSTDVTFNAVQQFDSEGMRRLLDRDDFYARVMYSKDYSIPLEDIGSISIAELRDKYGSQVNSTNVTIINPRLIQRIERFIDGEPAETLDEYRLRLAVDPPTEDLEIKLHDQYAQLITLHYQEWKLLNLEVSDKEKLQEVRGQIKELEEKINLTKKIIEDRAMMSLRQFLSVGAVAVATMLYEPSAFGVPLTGVKRNIDVVGHIHSSGIYEDRIINDLMRNVDLSNKYDIELFQSQLASALELSKAHTDSFKEDIKRIKSSVENRKIKFIAVELDRKEIEEEYFQNRIANIIKVEKNLTRVGVSKENIEQIVLYLYSSLAFYLKDRDKEWFQSHELKIVGVDTLSIKERQIKLSNKMFSLDLKLAGEPLSIALKQEMQAIVTAHMLEDLLDPDRSWEARLLALAGSNIELSDLLKEKIKIIKELDRLGDERSKIMAAKVREINGNIVFIFGQLHFNRIVEQLTEDSNLDIKKYPKSDYKPKILPPSSQQEEHPKDTVHKDKDGSMLSNTGGIDLTSDKSFQVINDNGTMRFNIDPAMMAQLKQAPGFVPVIMNITPMTDLKRFLGAM